MYFARSTETVYNHVTTTVMLHLYLKVTRLIKAKFHYASFEPDSVMEFRFNPMPSHKKNENRGCK